jgi:hypothetical protein
LSSRTSEIETESQIAFPAPMRLSCLSKPSAVIESHTLTIPVRQQYLFKLVTSHNRMLTRVFCFICRNLAVNENLLDIQVTDVNNDTLLNYEILQGRSVCQSIAVYFYSSNTFLMLG